MTWTTHIPKFRRFVLQNFPFIEQDFDALTDYQLICKVVEYLNKVISSQNALISEMESYETGMNANFANLQALFDELKEFVDNYFDNLDVQEEINNKLDQMVEDGTLQEIIASYLNANAIWGFDTVNDMVNATNLINGSFARTIGYRAKNDGGGSLYKIRTITNDDVVDGGSIIEMSDDSLIAELIVENGEINPNQFGAYGDGVHDDILFLNAASNYAQKHHLILSANPSSVYGISEGFSIYSGYSVDFKLATIKALTNMDYVVRQHKPKETAESIVTNEFTKNLVIDADNKANYGFYQDIFGWSILTDNIRVLNPVQIGIYIKTGQIRLENSKVEQENNNVYCTGLQVDSTDSLYFNIVTRECTSGIIINGGGNIFDQVHPVMFRNQIQDSKGIIVNQPAVISNSIIDTFQYGFYINTDQGCKISNCECVINTNYYTTERVDSAPYYTYFTNTGQDYSARMCMIGNQMTAANVWGEETFIFSNLTQWFGSPLVANNPGINKSVFKGKLPKEIMPLYSDLNISDLINSTVTTTSAVISRASNITQYRLNISSLPTVAANTYLDIASNIPTNWCTRSNVYKYMPTANGVIVLIVLTNDGRIRMRPVTQVTSGDQLYLGEIFID